MTPDASQNPSQSDDSAIGQIILGLLVALLALVLLPLVLPMLAWSFVPTVWAIRARYWAVGKWRVMIDCLGVIVCGIAVAIEAALAVSWLQVHDVRSLFSDLPTSVLPVLPWVGLHAGLGVLLVPAALSLRRRGIARKTRLRQIPDVHEQEEIERARRRAADLIAARRAGIKLDPVTGQVRGSTRRVSVAPLAVGDDRWAFGRAHRPTVQNVAELLQDTKRPRDWMQGHDHIALPAKAGAARAVVVAESGTGKTVLLNGLVLTAARAGWRVVMLDGKGDPADARQLARLVSGVGHSAEVAATWHLYSGTAAQITSKLMRLLPTSQGEGQHYTDEQRGVLAAIQSQTPLTSTSDLRDRLARPTAHVESREDLALLTRKVDKDMTAAQRVWAALAPVLTPLEPYISPDGWQYTRLPADVTIVPLLPVDDAQRAIGDLMLHDLRAHMARRLTEGDRSPLLVIVDEFAQLIGGTSDPGETAAQLLETARSAGMGLILAAQTTSGLSPDETTRARILGSGAAAIIGRSKTPEESVKLAGTSMRLEATGAATGDRLGSGRAQHAYLIPPQDVREAADGQAWLIHAGAVAGFRVLPHSELAGRPATDAGRRARRARARAQSPVPRLLPRRRTSATIEAAHTPEVAGDSRASLAAAAGCSAPLALGESAAAERDGAGSGHSGTAPHDPLEHWDWSPDTEDFEAWRY